MLKKHIFGVGVSLASIFCMASSAEAYEPVSDISLRTGYRSDEIKHKSRATDVGNTRVGGEVKFKDLNIWEFGLRGQYAITGFSCGCENDWMDRFFVKGCATWGWGSDGKTEFGTFDEGFSGSSSGSGSGSGAGSSNFFSHIRNKDTKTYDYSIGLGWVYEVDCNWAIAPSVGYAWDRLTTKSKHRFDNSSSSGDVIDIVDLGSSSSSSSFSSSSGNDRALFNYSSKWYGPWLGVELLYEDCDWRANLGYEFHWASHRTKITTDTDLFSDVGTRKSSSRYGNLVYLEGWYDLCEGWEIGLAFKYLNFQSGKGKSHRHSSGSDSLLVVEAPPVSSSSSSGPRRHEGHTTWSSWAVTLDLGYKF